MICIKITSKIYFKSINNTLSKLVAELVLRNNIPDEIQSLGVNSSDLSPNRIRSFLFKI